MKEILKDGVDIGQKCDSMKSINRKKTEEKTMRAIKQLMCLMVMLLGMVLIATPAQANSDSCFLPYDTCEGLLSPYERLSIYTEDVDEPDFLELTPKDKSASYYLINLQDGSKNLIDLYAPKILHTSGATEWLIYDIDGELNYSPINQQK
ncbi:MAG: hypothetical protein F6J90_15315 [Moorea sp. SIOASIH]|uniref:hypothetical protein n=1 Tax=Moorena sp. SIOASIH TaxID=2607817 RepID=UPI0013B753F8|nr:hypothetical protein [Moorena sp. SIOASIH]NEO37623.1 hypothetical protein [Moorena sp. SIOASIH]